MMVYRFLNEQFALECLQTNSLKVGRLNAFNDPADCLPILEGAPDQGSDEANTAFEKKYFHELYRDFGALCFSSAITDPVVWSHYSDSHKGIALGYEFEPLNRGQDPYEVKYDKLRPRIAYHEAEALRIAGNRASEAFVEKIATNGFTRKAKSWAYEKEFRLFVALSRCEMRGPHYFHTPLGGAPNRVVLGLRSNLSENDVYRAMRSPTTFPVPSGVEILRARMDRKNYELVISAAHSTTR